MKITFSCTMFFFQAGRAKNDQLRMLGKFGMPQYSVANGMHASSNLSSMRPKKSGYTSSTSVCIYSVVIVLLSP